MKEIYEVPSIEVIKFENTDSVIMISTLGPGDPGGEEVEDPFA